MVASSSMASLPPADRLNTVEDKVDSLTIRVTSLEGKLDSLTIQTSTLEEKVDVLTVRMGVVETKIDALTADMHASDDETRRYMRVQHEEVLERIRTLGESRF